MAKPLFNPKSSSREFKGEIAFPGGVAGVMQLSSFPSVGLFLIKYNVQMQHRAYELPAPEVYRVPGRLVKLFKPSFVSEYFDKGFT